MKIYPYQTPEGIIELVEEREYNKLEAELLKEVAENKDLRQDLHELRAANAELIERLRERTESHLAASARDVQTIQRQSVDLASADREIERLNLMVEMMDESKELAKWRAIAERMANDLRGLANMPEYDQDDAHRLRHIASKALSAYESAKGELPEMKLWCAYCGVHGYHTSGSCPQIALAEAIARMEAVDTLPSVRVFTTMGQKIGEAMNDFRARLIQAAKGES